MFYWFKHKFAMLTPAQMAANDIAQAERDLYDARKRHEDSQAVIDLHENRIRRLRQQYPQPEVTTVQMNFVLPADAQPTGNKPGIGKVREFMGWKSS